MIDKKEIQTQFTEILQDLSEIIKKNNIPNYSFSQEEKIENIDFDWKTVQGFFRSNLPNEQLLTKETLKQFNNSLEEEKNYRCNLCPDKFSGIRSFIKKGAKPILVLHYSSETGMNQAIVKNEKLLIFKDEYSKSIFQELIYNTFCLNLQDLYYQEFPGCSFKSSTFDEKSWISRTNNCKIHVQNTIQTQSIKGIIMFGNSAILQFGKKIAEENLGKILNFLGIPLLIIRSPESFSSIHNKIISLKNKNPEKENEFKLMEERIKEEIQKSLSEFAKKVIF